MTCTHPKAKCIDSRPNRKNRYRMRRYECTSCGHRWTTVEVEVATPGHGHSALSMLQARYGITPAQEKAIMALVESFGARPLDSPDPGL